MWLEKTCIKSMALAACIASTVWLVSGNTRTAAQISPGASMRVTFRDFSGTNYTPPGATAPRLGNGWARQDFYWSDIEAKKGSWDWKKTDDLVRGDQAQNLQTLPMLGYNVSWDMAAGARNVSPPENVADWENFVEHVVTRYSAPPFNLRYFQVWNEPTRQAGFWTGTDQRFVDEVYIPAAKIIRNHHCFVVFGGWPASNSVQEYDSLLEYHDAWRWTDILDIHYEGLAYWQHLYERWVKLGKCRGVWETEISSYDTDYIPATYLTMLHWSLETRWEYPDEFKLFWFAAWGAGTDARECLTTTDPKNAIVLTVQGTRLAVLSQVLGAGPLTTFSEYQITPTRLKASTLGFKSGQRIVIAMLFDRSGVLHLPLLGIRVLAPKASAVEVIDEGGSSLRRTVSVKHPYSDVAIPLAALAQKSGKLAIAYLELGPGSSHH